MPAKQPDVRTTLAQIEAMISGGDRPTVNEQNAFEHFTALNRFLLEIRDMARAALRSNLEK